MFFQNAGKFGYRYSMLGFQDAAHLDDGDVWPVTYALKTWSPVVEEKVAGLVRAAIPDRGRNRRAAPAPSPGTVAWDGSASASLSRPAVPQL